MNYGPISTTTRDQEYWLELLHELIFAYERFDLTWRQRLSLDAGEKSAIVLLAAHGAVQPDELREQAGLDLEEFEDVIDGLRRRGYVQPEVDNDPPLVTYTKRGLRLRTETSALISATASEAAQLVPGHQVVIESFLRSVRELLERRSAELR